LIARFKRTVPVLLLCFAASTTLAAAGDEHWDNQFGWPGPGGNNYAIAVHNGRIYVSGLGGSTNVALQVWDGAQWSAMSQFYGPSSTAVNDLAFVGDTLYAAGSFTNVDGVAANGLAKWDGTSWSSIGFKGLAYSLAVDGGNLYVGGSFVTNLSGLAMRNVGRWDGSAWSPLGNGLGSTNLSLVYAIAATNGIVYAGGYFTNSGPVGMTNAARWDGVAWSALGGGPSGIPVSLTVKGAEVYVGGQFGSSGVSRWDGVSWTLVGSGFDQGAQSVTVFNNLICAAGSFTTVGVSASRFAVWNGSSWAAAGSGLSGNGNRVYSNGTNLYVGGNFLLAGGIIVNGLASWDGSTWTQIGTPGRCNGAHTTVRAIGTDGANLFVGGSFLGIGQTNAPYVARFDGTRWHSLGTGIGPSSSASTVVNALVVSNTDVYVGGYFSTAGGVSAQSVARWDGASWHGLGGPGGMVYALAVRPEGLYALGTGYNGSTYGSAFCKLWNGTSWQDALAFNPDDTFTQIFLNDIIGMNSIAFIGGDTYVGGHFGLVWHDSTLSVYTNCGNILRFDGTYARVVGTGFNSNANAMAAIGTDLYVAGPFTNAGGVTVSGIARWDGNNWWDVGGGVVGRGVIATLTVLSNDLYAGGSFTNLGGVAATRIAKWDGNNWSALGSGVSATVLGLFADGSDLYAAGSLRLAGGKSSMFIGHWNDEINFNTPKLVDPHWLSNSQFRVRLYGASGLTNLIEATTNLTDWASVWTNTSGVYDFTDKTATNYSRRFYRVKVLP
jgi:hypothetical protein